MVLGNMLTIPKLCKVPCFSSLVIVQHGVTFNLALITVAPARRHPELHHNILELFFALKFAVSSIKLKTEKQRVYFIKRSQLLLSPG